MFNLVAVLHCLEMAVAPLAFLVISWLLLAPKISRRTALGAMVLFLAAEAALQTAILFLGKTPEFAAVRRLSAPEVS